ncbi:alpha/beta hydrolase family protein [Sphingomonas qilianensis]|uniref:Prolyl oligopeptidase family serine peptidase n=1 Tax=Sphingomonas qilianensis TaxID=1736690 RepID=A0ABU9XUF2_9SPHN
MHLVRKASLVLLLLAAAIFGGALVQFGPGVRAELGAYREDRSRNYVTVPAFGAAKEMTAQFYPAKVKAPLIVDLHQWGEDARGFAGKHLDEQVKAKGWNFIRPALAGPNRTPDACCSAGVIDGVLAAIEYAKQHGPVDPTSIYVVGISGGGYTTLCAAMSNKVNARGYYAWASITDLEEWYNQHRTDNYGSDIMQCTASRGSLNLAEARRRSPIYMGMPAKMSPIHMYAGIQDGFQGSVPISHSVKMFNRFADTYSPQQRVTDAQLLRMMERREGDDTAAKQTIDGRTIHLRRSAGPAELVVFEGEHEMLSTALVDAIAQDQVVKSKP